MWYSWNLTDILRVILKYLCKQCSEQVVSSGFTSLVVKSGFCKFTVGSKEFLKLHYWIRFWYLSSHTLFVCVSVTFFDAWVSSLFWKSGCSTFACMSPKRSDFIFKHRLWRHWAQAGGWGSRSRWAPWPWESHIIFILEKNSALPLFQESWEHKIYHHL